MQVAAEVPAEAEDCSALAEAVQRASAERLLLVAEARVELADEMVSVFAVAVAGEAVEQALAQAGQTETQNNSKVPVAVVARQCCSDAKEERAPA